MSCVCQSAGGWLRDKTRPDTDHEGIKAVCIEWYLTSKSSTSKSFTTMFRTVLFALCASIALLPGAFAATICNPGEIGIGETASTNSSTFVRTHISNDFTPQHKLKAYVHFFLGQLCNHLELRLRPAWPNTGWFRHMWPIPERGNSNLSSGHVSNVSSWPSSMR